jgi:hypothetical protein
MGDSLGVTVPWYYLEVGEDGGTLWEPIVAPLVGFLRTRMFLGRFSAHMTSKRDFFFDRVEEKDPYYSFLKLHLTKEHGKAGKQQVWFDGVSAIRV